MNSTLKNIIISLIITLVTFTIIGFVHHSKLTIPTTGGELLTLALIFCAVLAGTFLGHGRSSHPGYASSFETGTVKWFNTKKGYGFITRDAGDDIFVHYRNLEGSGRRSISEGERVQFIVIEGDKGLQADEVESI